jgi:hypothetical protein
VSQFKKISAAVPAVLLASTASGACIPINGTVNATPDPTCQIVNAASGIATSEAMDILIASVRPSAEVCLSIAANIAPPKNGQVTGYSGLTSVPVAGSFGVTNTPLVYPSGGVRTNLMGFTSLAVLTTTIGIGSKELSGKLVTKDTGTIDLSTGVVGQILQVVGGTGDFAGATGIIAVAGQEVGGAAGFTGQVCTPD